MIQERLARYATSLAEAEPPVEVAAAARRVVIDWFAAVLAGGAQPPATLLIEALAAEELGRGRAVLYPGGLRAPLRSAALINGAASHTLEVDDIYRHGLYHPGTVVIPAALAAAQARGADGGRFLRAVIAGYEVSNRIAVAVTPAHYAFWHTTATVGHFGAAAAVAAILGLDAERAAHALANAATMAAGLQQAFRSDAMSKPLHAGQAAANGALAALAAEAGVSGAARMLEGAAGFGAAMSEDPDWEAALADLGRVYTILDTTQKVHAACGHAHAAIDAMLVLRARHGLTPGEVKRVTVGVYRAALEITGNPSPVSAFEAKFSTPYCVSVALAAGQVRGAAFGERWLGDGGLRALLGRVELTLDAEAEAAFPGRRGAVVEVETVSGERLTERRHTRKGDPDDPLSETELVDKFHELTDPVIGRGAGEVLLAALGKLEGLGDMAALPFTARRPIAAD